MRFVVIGFCSVFDSRSGQIRIIIGGAVNVKRFLNKYLGSDFIQNISKNYFGALKIIYKKIIGSNS